MSSNPNTITSSELNEKQKAVCVITNGCTEGRMDSALLEQFFQESADFQLCKDCMKAGLIVFVGCCATQDKEYLSRLTIETLRLKKRPDAQILVTGCLAKLQPELTCNDGEFKDLVDQINRLLHLEDKQNLAVHFPQGEFWEIAPNLLDQSTSKGMISKYYNQVLTGILPRISSTLNAAIIKLFGKYRRLIDKEMLVSGNKTFFIKACTGCMGNCSYCSIKLARGRIKSKPLDAVLQEFKLGLDQGYTDFALVGTDIGDYGKDLGTDLLDLLERLVSHEEKFTLRLRNVNPRWLIPSVQRFCELLKTGRIGYLLSPVESGSNRILKSMHRGYSIEDYIEAIRKIRNAYPPLFVKTQIIVGFPGETDEDFNKSKELFKLGLFDYADICTFAKRPRTRAWNLPDK
ncbi:MAG: radical SAM protein, partial [Sedimentisphaerales bacterium]